jgi:hypothetical protein
MNYKEYLESFIEDLNLIYLGKLEFSDPKGHNLFRLRVLMLHLHADHLLTEIISSKFKESFKLSSCKNQWDIKSNDFMEKLRIVYATGDFEEGFFNALKILNKIRNDLIHNLNLNINGEINRINQMEVNPTYKNLLGRELYPIEHLIFACLGYINVLAEYLWGTIRKEKLEYWIKMEVTKPTPPYTSTSLFLFNIDKRP